MAVIALVVADLERGRLGTARRLGAELAGRAVLAHTVARAAAPASVDRVVVLHPPGQDPTPLLAGLDVGKPVVCAADPDGLRGAESARLAASRKWADAAWRGGLGFATCFDELLPAAPLARAAAAHDARAVLLVGGDWCLVDPGLAEAQLRLHLEQPEAHRLCFTQACPGLAGLVITPAVLDDLAQHRATLGRVLGYNPRQPAIDPISRELNLPIDPAVRDLGRRLVYDTPRAIDTIHRLAERLGEALPTADALAVARACAELDREDASSPPARLPRDVTIELTPRRTPAGPITPHHHTRFDRPDLDTAHARRLLDQLGDAETAGDTVLTLGGLGDALLHPDWAELVEHAHAAGVLGVAIETDLLCEPGEVERLLGLPVGVVSVRLNADCGETYRRVMGLDAFETVTGNLRALFEKRAARGEAGGRLGVPWIVPRLIKTAETLADLESFFDRWLVAGEHAVIEPATTGCGLMPAQSPVVMAPPRRRPCRQLAGRMTILSDGQVALCDQDWLARSPLGDSRSAALIEIWRSVAEVRRAHEAGRYEGLSLCAGCVEWHRP